MQYTTNHNLKKPESTDHVNVSDFNDNADIIDALIPAEASSSNKCADKNYVQNAITGKQDALTFDDAPTAGSVNPVKSGGIKSAIDAKQDALTFDNTPTANSNNPVKSKGIKTALDGKQNTLTFDNTPTANSDNPVKSKGIKTALDGKQSTDGVFASGAKTTAYKTTGGTVHNTPQFRNAIIVDSIPSDLSNLAIGDLIFVKASV